MMDVFTPIVDIFQNLWESRKESVDASSLSPGNQLEHNLSCYRPTHSQDTPLDATEVDILDHEQSWPAEIPKILSQDRIISAQASMLAALKDENHFGQSSTIRVDSSSSYSMDQELISSHIGSHHSIDLPSSCTISVAEVEKTLDPSSAAQQRRKEKVFKSKKIRGNPKKQILNPKPDSEVSAETRERRAKRQKKEADRLRWRENRERKVLNLQGNAVEAAMPCSESQIKGEDCIIEASNLPFPSQAPPEPTSNTLRSNISDQSSSATYVSKCVPPSTVPNPASRRKFACSTCRKRRKRCERTRNGPDGPCDACCDKEDSVTTIPLSPKAKTARRSLNCIKKRRACRFPADIPNQNLPRRNRKHIASYPEYSKNWFLDKYSCEKKKILQYLIDTLDPNLRSGMARTAGPCTRCLSLGKKCMVIQPGSIASILSPKTTCCSNCLGAVGGDVSGPWKVIRKCCNAEEGRILSETVELATVSNSRPPDPSSIVQTTQVPLKDPDNGNGTKLEQFRRRSVRNFAYALPKEALDPYEVSAKMNLIDFWIQRLSHSAFILTNQVRERSPLRDHELSQLETLTANQSSPTVLDAIQKLLGVSTLGDLRIRTRELGLEAIPYMQVVRAVTSMTMYNVIFSIDPFADDLHTAMLIKILETDQLYCPHKSGLAVQYYHLGMLRDDLNFKAKLRDKAEVAGQLMWNILEPLVTLGQSGLEPSVLEDCRTFCSTIAGFASQLNAEIKARVIRPQICWNVSGDVSDDDCFEDVGGWSIQIVQLAVLFCIKQDHPLGPPTVYAKGKVVGV